VIGRLVNLLAEEGEKIIVRGSVAISPDESDNAFCACAQLGTANYIITNNVKHFPQSRLRARVISPGAIQLATWTAAPRPQIPQEYAQEYKLFFHAHDRTRK
jgi:hypothetical protein